jgi:hypothetical protein
MAINTLNFLNKNQFRSYPLKAGAVLTSIDGRKITNELLVGLSISTTSDRRNLFIRQISASNGNITITVAAELDNGYFESLGAFSGIVATDFTTLELNSYLPFTSGNIIIGSSEAASNLSGVYTFHKESLQLEESTVFYYTPPPVKSVVNKGINLRGNVGFGVLSNLVKSRDGNNILFGVIDSASVTSLADLHSAFNNCSTPVIRYIDGAVPFYDTSGVYPALQGNLFMVGVAPIVFYGEQGENTVDGNSLPIYNGGISVGTVSLSGIPLTLDTLCTTSNAVLPPINPNYIHNLPDDISTSPTFVGNQSYYTKSRYIPSNFITSNDPEFTWWPQFLSSLTSSAAISAEEGANTNIGIIPALTGAKNVIAISLANAGTATLNITIQQNGSNMSDYTGVIINPQQSVTILAKNPTGVEAGDTFNVQFNGVTGGTSFLIPYILYR